MEKGTWSNKCYVPCSCPEVPATPLTLSAGAFVVLFSSITKKLRISMVLFDVGESFSCFACTFLSMDSGTW